MTADSRNGIETFASPRLFADSVAHFESLLAARGLTLFAKIDFAGDAKKAGMQMQPTMLLVFGNPKAGTPLMIASPSIAIDLPMKALIWEDANGKVWISYNAPGYLQTRHGLPLELTQNVAVVEALAINAAM